MIKRFLATLLIVCLLPFQASAQSIDADTCIQVANIMYQIGEGKKEGIKLEQQLNSMREAVPAGALRKFYEQLIKEAYQTKKSPEDFAQDFANRCFNVRGDISKLMGKKT